MASARKDIINEDEVRTYHCISRCVRRAFLCGFDILSQKSFEHRKGWVRDRIKFLSKIFLIDMGGYAIMSNHLHLIFKTRPDVAKALSDEKILERWNLLFPSGYDENGKVFPLSENKLKILLLNTERIKELRRRLTSVSWFMRCLNEFIARKANIEDKCKGRFWEGRFKCQALLSEGAILTCMTYVDLNPIRAKITGRLEESDYTSIKERLSAYKAEKRINSFSFINTKTLSSKQKIILADEQKIIDSARWLSPIRENSAFNDAFVNINLKKYVELLEWTGKEIREGKRGKIPDSLSSVLTRFEINNKRWVQTVKTYGTLFYRVAGKFEDALLQAKYVGKKWFRGITDIKLSFSA